MDMDGPMQATMQRARAGKMESQRPDWDYIRHCQNSNSATQECPASSCCTVAKASTLGGGPGRSVQRRRLLAPPKRLAASHGLQVPKLSAPVRWRCSSTNELPSSPRLFPSPPARAGVMESLVGVGSPDGCHLMYVQGRAHIHTSVIIPSPSRHSGSRVDLFPLLPRARSLSSPTRSNPWPKLQTHPGHAPFKRVASQPLHCARPSAT